MKNRKTKPEGYAYKVGKLPLGNSGKDDCRPFGTVFYICHVEDAYRIFEDGRIRSSLVWDKSKLRNTRTCVSWASANTWAGGSIYGNIRFDFDWAELIEGKQFYWVEAIKYQPHAFRILVSENDHSPAGLARYDAESGDGPLFYNAK